MWGGLAPCGGGLSEDKLEQRELRQHPALLQKPGRKYSLVAHRKTGQFCPGRAAKIPASRKGGWQKRLLLRSELGELNEIVVVKEKKNSQ